MSLTTYSIVFGMEGSEKLLEQYDTSKLAETYIEHSELLKTPEGLKKREEYFKMRRECFVNNAKKLMEERVPCDNNILEMSCFLISLMDEHSAIFKQLLEYGVNPILYDSKKENILICLIDQKCPKNLTILLDKIALQGKAVVKMFVNERDKISNQAPLEMAINSCTFKHVDFEIIEILLAWEANPNETDCDGNSALSLLVKRYDEMQNKDECVGIFKTLFIALFLKGADPRIPNNEQKNAIQIACEKGFVYLLPSYI